MAFASLYRPLHHIYSSRLAPDLREWEKRGGGREGKENRVGK
jgi:hypothetical protein